MRNPLSSFFHNLRTDYRTRLITSVPLLLILAGIAIYVWTIPIRQEQQLSKASFDELRARVKKEPDNARLLYHFGVRLRQAGHDGPALAAFERAGALDPNDFDIWLAWAATAGAFHNDQEAFGILTSFSNRHPQNGRAHLALAFLYAQANAEQRAYEQALAAAKLDNNLPEGWRLAGAMALQLHLYTESVTYFQKAIAVAKNDWRAWVGLGNAYQAQHNQSDALAAFQAAEKIVPNDPSVLTALGSALLDKAQTPADVLAAQEKLAKAVNLVPDSQSAQMALGRANVRAENWTQARDAFVAAMRLNPNDPDPHFQLIRVYKQLGDTAKALGEQALHNKLRDYQTERLRLASEVWQHPTDKNYRLAFARFLSAHGETQAAIENYQRLLAINPKDANATKELTVLQKTNREMVQRTVTLPMPADATLSELPSDQLLRDADAMFAKGRILEAERTYRVVLGRDDKNARANQGVGLALLNKGNRDEAFRFLHHAVELDPKLSEAEYSLAHLYFDSDFPDEAARHMRHVVKVTPNNPEYWHSLGLSLVSGGSAPQTAEAVDAFANAVRLDPKNPGLLRDLANTEVLISRLKEGETHYRAASALDRKDPVSQQLLGSFLVEHEPSPERLAEAETLLKASLATIPNNPNAQLSLGGLLLLRGKAKEAVPYIESSIEAQPTVDVAWYRLERAYTILGNKQRADYCRTEFQRMTKAKIVYERAEEDARLHLKDPTKRLTLARLMAKSQDFAKSINQYQMTLRLDPKNAVAKQELDVLTKRLKAEGRMPRMESFQGMMVASVLDKK